MATVHSPSSPPVSVPVPPAPLGKDRDPRPAPAKPARPDRQAWQEERAKWTANGIDWPIAFWIGVIHLGALAAPFVFTWQGLVLWLGLWWLTGAVGITMGFHRLFTHAGFETYRPIRCLIAWIGGLAGEGSVVHWVANHRKHHAFSDQVGDPHSPLDGPWWAHMLWTMGRKLDPQAYRVYNTRWAPDIMKDPFLVFLDRTFLLWHVLLGGALFGVGYLWGGAYLAWSLVVWGMFLRLTCVLHSTWLVNSATHMWGYRNYQTKDESRNLWWVALLTFGEGWHNNHHAYPRLARHGHKWWEIDGTWLMIRALRACGLVWNVVDFKHQQRHDDAG